MPTWSEVANVPIEGRPNTKELVSKLKDNVEKSLEDPDTQVGRNAIRGQSILMLKAFPYEADSHKLNDLIMISRCVELGAPIPTHLLIGRTADDVFSEYTFLNEDLINGKVKEEDKKKAAEELKKVLNEFRTNYVENDRFKAPTALNIQNEVANQTADGRNYIRTEAAKWLKANPRNDQNGEAYDAIKAALDLSTKTETGQIYEERNDDGTPKVPKPEDKFLTEEAKRTSTEALRVALTTVITPVADQPSS